jgi:NDP-sugar pyrophosphorylase family protein
MSVPQQAVILAGGLGTRLWPLTKEVPKPMVPIHGVPYLEHQLRYLAEQSITNIVLLIGYLGEQIEQHFGSGERWGLSIAYSWEKSPLGTGGALREAGPLLAESFLLLYGDSFLPMRYADVLEQLAAHPTSQGAVVVYDNRHGDTDVKSNIALSTQGFVKRYEKDVPHDPELTYVEAGVSAFRRSILKLMPPGKVSLENEIFPQLIAAQQLSAVVTKQRFYDIGTPDRLKTIANYFQS